MLMLANQAVNQLNYPIGSKPENSVAVVPMGVMINLLNTINSMATSDNSNANDSEEYSDYEEVKQRPATYSQSRPACCQPPVEICGSSKTGIFALFAFLTISLDLVVNVMIQANITINGFVNNTSGNNNSNNNNNNNNNINNRRSLNDGMFQVPQRSERSVAEFPDKGAQHEIHLTSFQLMTDVHRGISSKNPDCILRWICQLNRLTSASSVVGILTQIASDTIVRFRNLLGLVSASDAEQARRLGLMDLCRNADQRCPSISHMISCNII